MKAITLTLLFSLSALLAVASTDYTSSTYTVFGDTYTFTNKLDLGAKKFVYDCYMDEDGTNVAIVVKCNDATGMDRYDEWSAIIPGTVTCNGKSYTVTTIADNAFSTTTSFIGSVTIPNSVTGIGHEAFKNCYYITSIQMSKNVISIGDRAFSSCTALESIELPSSLNYLGKNLFSACLKLKYILFDINPDCFDWYSLTVSGTFSMPGNVTAITQTREQANLAKKLFDKVISFDSEAYIESLEKTISDNKKTMDENNMLMENIASQYTMIQQENQALQVHNKNLNNCDVNQDGQVNSADVVTIYNRIIEGTETYNGQQYVDLGLPSGTLWATCNVGAPSPECVGDYFAWGENGFYSYRYGLAFGKYSFTEDTYTPAPGVEEISDGEWPQEYSPLKVIYISQWDGWKIPTWDQAKELTNNCTKEVVTINGQECLELTSNINKRKIYFPLNGKIDGTSAKETNEVFYWTSTTGSSKYYADIIPFQLHSYIVGKDRYLGMGIRPVIMKEDVEK